MSILADGKVGIGTTAPSSLLTLRSQGVNPILASLRSGTSTSEQFKIVQAESSAFVTGRGTSSGQWANIIESRNSNLILTTFLAGGTGGKIILDADNVGIGTTAPLDLLHLAAGGKMRIAKSGDASRYTQYEYAGVNTNANDGYSIKLGGTNKVKIINDSLGIMAPSDTRNAVLVVNHAGTTTPTDNIELIGSAIAAPGGTAIFFKGSSNTTLNRYGARIHSIRDATADNGATHLVFSNENAGATSVDEHMRIQHDGNVGIGTTAPVQKLDVVGNINITGANTNTGFDRYFKMYGNSDPATNTNRWAGIGLYNNGGNNVNELAFFTGTGDGARTEKVRINNLGNVGIGTTAPKAKLHVNGDIVIPYDSYLYFEGDKDDAFNRIGRYGSENAILLTARYDVGILIDSNNDDTLSAFTVGHNGTTLATAGTLLRVQSDGNVGIGTATPANALHVYNTTGNASAILLDGSASNSGFLSFRQSGVEKSYIQYTANSYLRYFAAGGHNFAQNVGINTTAPGQKLSVEGAGTANENVVRFNNQGNYASRIWLRNSGSSAYISQAGGTADTLATGLIASSLSIGHSGGGGMQWWTWNGGAGNVVRMSLSDSGNLGIGTTAPSSRLHVAGTGDVARIGDNRWMGTNTVTIGTTYVTGVTINLANHTGGYLKVTIAGDWTSHGAIGYLAEFFIQKGDASALAQPGTVIREVTNQHDSSYITAQILDPTLNSGNADFKIQFKTDAGTATNVTVIYEYIGIANSVT